MGSLFSSSDDSSISPEDFEQQAKDASLKHYTADPPKSIEDAILKQFPKIKDKPALIKYIYDISVKHAAAHSYVDNIECVLALRKAKDVFKEKGQCKDELKKIYDTYFLGPKAKNPKMLVGVVMAIGDFEKPRLVQGSRDGWVSSSDPSKYPWTQVERALQYRLYLALKPGCTKEFESIKEEVVAAGFTYYIQKPPPLIADIIKGVFPKIKDDDAKIKGVYDYLILYMDEGASTENIDFLNAMTEVRAMSKHGTVDCSDKLLEIFNHFWGKGTKYKVNMGHTENVALTAAAADGFKNAENDPNKGSWAEQVTTVTKMVKSVLEDAPTKPRWGHKIKELVDSAHRSHYNELLGMDDSIDNAQIAQSGYNYVGHDYEGHVIDGYKYIGTSHSSVYNNGHGYFADPTAMLLIAISLCLCVGCVLFVNFISCVVGYIVGRYREEFVHSKEREREYESEHV